MRIFAAALLLAACQAPDDEIIDDIDGAKEDAVASSTFLRKVDAAGDRVWLQISTLSSTLSTHLTAAADRGVDVELELVSAKPGDGATVLAAQGLEATGVHVTVDRTNPVSGIRGVIDDHLFIPSSSRLKTVTDSAQVAAAVAKLTTAFAEPTQGADPLPAGHVRLLPMPESTAGSIAAIIDGAKTSIDLEIYQLEDALVTSALVRAAGRQVAVRVMLEPKTVGAANYDPQSKILAAAGITVQPTPPAFDGSGNVDHAKFFIVDGKELVFGSGNLVRSGLGGNHAGEFDTRDFWVRDSRKAIVAQAIKLFAADWARHATTADLVSSLVVTPDNADGAILNLIGQASQRLYVYNQSLSDSAILAALIAAKQRGADVRVLLGYQPGYGGQPPKNQAALDKLTAAGIPAVFYRRHYLHGKCVISDDRAFIGSQNFTSGGLKNNRELGQIFDDVDLVDELVTTFLADQAAP
jgi:phosphatidylserine/phosphatidylglycerophosphate/cardiolipin synthase-like enzyme